MLEDTFWEEDIWEYKSKRKPKPARPNNCSQNIPESAGRTTDGKHQTKVKGNKKRTRQDKDKAQDPGASLRETDCPVSVGSSQNSSATDEIRQSQSSETTPRKHCRTHKNKQVSPRVRPVYDGYCPSCQMPFSSLLGQTPRWHVFECLDSPPISDTECPEGLLCSSTIPSHYKKYTHLLLAQSRAGSEPPCSPSQVPAGHFTAAKPASSCDLGERWPVHLKAESLRRVLDDSLLTIQCLKTLPLSPETDRESPSSTKSQMPPVSQCTDKLVRGGLPLPEDSVNRHSAASPGAGLPSPESDSGDGEISYSPLQSEEETHDLDQGLDDSQQELFCTQSSEDDGSAPFETFHDPFPRDPEGVCLTAGSLGPQADCSGLCEGSALRDSLRVLSQTKSSLSQDQPPCTDAGFLRFSPASAAGPAASNYQASKAKPGEPEGSQSLGSSHQKGKMETPAVGHPIALPLGARALSEPLEKRGLERRPLHQDQSQRLQSLGSGATVANSACACGKVEKRCGTPLAKSLSTLLPSSPKCSASQPSKKVMKQMDIGVFFGLPPKRQEPSPRESASGGPGVSPGASPNKQGPRPCKRKAEKSLSDLELDSGGLRGSQYSAEQPGERPHGRRKRRKRSDSPQEGVRQRRPRHPIDSAELRAVSVNKSRASVRRPHGRPQRGGLRTSSGARESGRACPFYKRIPGTGFTVDAFQYGEIEGCTAYFLTHFHSDHYAGLSKDFQLPIYCSEITGNLLKKKLRVQEQHIHQLPMDTECIVDGVRVVLLDANHCPGASMILFRPPNGTAILHTGDFRADPSMERSLLAGLKVHTLYLDTTYCSPEYTFPSQQEVIQFAINAAFEAVTLNPRALVVCGTYCIGKEKVFLAIADVLGSKVGMSQEKYKTLQCLNIPEVNSLITTDMCSSLVHLLPMAQINFQGLQSHLKKCGGKYNQILAFRPTGWTHSNNITGIADIAPQTKGNISIYGIPYSEHSSYLEMKRFVQWLKPQKIIPTVNVGSFESRNAMEKYFKEWRLEAGY